MDLEVVMTDLDMEFDLDPKMMEGFGLDPKKTMDYSLFKKFTFQFIFPFVDRESMEEIVHCTVHDYVKRLPPLEVILFDGLVETAWGWDRLLPWKSNCLLFEDYFGYLSQYYGRNRSYPFVYLGVDICHGEARLNAKAATESMKAEAALNAIVAAHSGVKSIAHDHVVLSQRITDEACKFMELHSQPAVPAGSAVPSACFLCITEEAKLMSKVLTMSNAKADEFPGRLWQMYFEFGNEVRQAAVKILTTYKGPYSEQVSAAVLGMQREAIQACRLLDQEVDNIEDELHISIDIREHLLDLLKIISEFFPCQSEIKYSSIRDARISLGSNLIGHLYEPRQEIESPITTRSSAPASPLAWNSDGINSVLPATPPSLAWSANANESCLSMGRSQDSDMPSTRHTERRRDSGTAEKLVFQTPSVGVAAPETPMEDMLSAIASMHLCGLVADMQTHLKL